MKRVFKLKKSNGTLLGNFMGKVPSLVATKICTRLCKKLRKMKCAFTMVEMINNTPGKEFSYICQRKKLDKPITFNGRKIEYKSVVKRVFGKKMVTISKKPKRVLTKKSFSRKTLKK